jgi:hypothetical protein
VSALEARIARVITGVVRQALQDAHASKLIVLEPLAPEGRLFLGWCHEAGLDAVPASQATGWDGRHEDPRANRSALAVHPVNRTALLLGDAPREPVLPLGDVPASIVEACAGGWTGSEAVISLAARAGGVEALDGALFRWLERREPFAIATAELEPEVACALRIRFEASRFSRRRAGLVPKLSYRTVGHDLRI